MLEGIIVSVGCGDQLSKTLPHNRGLYDNLVVVTTPQDEVTQQVCKQQGVRTIITDACYTSFDAFNKGRMLLSGVPCLMLSDWVLLTDADCFLPPRLPDITHLSHQSLYYTIRRHVPPATTKYDPTVITNDHLADPAGNDGPWGYFQLFHAKYGARAMRSIPTVFCSAGTVDRWFMLQWPATMRKRLPTEYITLHLFHGDLSKRWNGLDSVASCNWQFSGITSISPEKAIIQRWPVPCYVRRICVETLEQHIVHYNGRPIVWPTGRKHGVTYEYSIRSVS